MTTQTIVPKVAKIESFQPETEKRTPRISVFGVACAIFVLVNLVCGELVREHLLKHPINDDPNIVLSHYAHLTRAPDVVLIGSSVIRFPLWLSDLAHGSDIADYDHYGWCSGLEKQIEAVGGKDMSVFDLGINSAMASDLYLIEEQLLKGNLQPQTIVYALGARDFMDDLVPDETRTEPFERLFKLANLIGEDQTFKTSTVQKTDLLLRLSMPLYQYRWQCQTKVKAVAQQLTEKLMQKRHSRNSLQENVRLAKATKASPPPELSKFAASDAPYKKDARWLNSVAEYEARYASPDFSQYQRQKLALEKMLDLAKERNIKILLVRLPVTKTELGLDPPGFLDAFSYEIRKIATAHAVRYVDLQGSDQYPSSDFFDIAHLNAEGGDKLSQVLAREILALDRNR